MRRIALLLLAGVMAVTTAFTVPAASAAPGPEFLSITAKDGVKLGAHLARPAGAGPHPVVVMVSSWGVNNLEYIAQTKKFADAGYVALSYTARGFYESGGLIDVAGPQDVDDASTVIDWVLTNTTADPAKVGLAGISYGSGISAITAAKDKRVRAVSAMSNWADLGRALVPNDTFSKQAIGLLDVAGRITGRPGPALTAALDGVARGDRDAVRALAAPRSEANYLEQLNTNKPAMLIANAWHDSLFPSGQISDFFTKLDLPKRLEFQPGDHAIPELTGVLGLPNDTWNSTLRWFDRYLRGANNGIDQEPQVRVKPFLGGAWQGYASWSALTASPERFYLGGLTPLLDRTGQLASAPKTGWKHSVGAGIDTIANSGIAMISGGAESLGIPQFAWLPGIQRTNAGVWQAPVLSGSRQLRGAPNLHLTVTPSASKTTLYAYLYDVDFTGTGRLLTHQPYTLLDAKPGVARALDITLNPVVHEVPAGHRLAVVVDTVDGRYTGESRIGTSVTFSSPAADPSRIDLPLS